MLEQLKNKKLIILPAEIFRNRTTKISKFGAIKLRDLATAMLDPVAPPTIQISGHVDATEDAAQDLALSRIRAQQIKQYLESMGVEGDRLKAVGFGGTRPIVPNLNAKSRITNLRTEISRLSGETKGK
jgi:outer membrane protein OmpA-like peptidoglycan-associated protein